MRETRAARSLPVLPRNTLPGDRFEILTALFDSPRRLPTRFLYDPLGAELFEAITGTRAYYPTRVETGILRAHAAELAALTGKRARIVEFGSGSGAKTQILLDCVDKPATYIPIDISCDQLAAFATGLRRHYEALTVLPVCADYTKPLSLPAPRGDDGRTVVFFPGSTIGNFEPAAALRFLQRSARLCQDDGFVVIGVDLKKDRAILERAYNDPDGITAAFNLNILTHVNRLLDSDFNLRAFRHQAFYNEAAGRIEMHLVSTRSQTVTFQSDDQDPIRIELLAGEPIVTEHSYKFEIAEFQQLSKRAGFTPGPAWTDRQQLFSVHLLFTGVGRQ